MVHTSSGENNIFWQVEKIHVADMHHEEHEFFGLLVNRNVGNQVLTNTLVVSSLQNLANNTKEVQHLYDRQRLDMKAKAI